MSQNKLRLKPIPMSQTSHLTNQKTCGFANIPTINGVEDLGLAHTQIIMDDDAYDRWSHCHSVVVEGTV